MRGRACYHTFTDFSFGFKSEVGKSCICMRLSLQEQFPKYWPTTPGESTVYGKLTAKLISEKQETSYTVRKIALAMDGNYVNMGSPKVIECQRVNTI